MSGHPVLSFDTKIVKQSLCICSQSSKSYFIRTPTLLSRGAFRAPHEVQFYLDLEYLLIALRCRLSIFDDLTPGQPCHLLQTGYFLFFQAFIDLYTFFFLTILAYAFKDLKASKKMSISRSIVQES